jgi:predicted choloylglycine hydrolase
MKKREYYFQGTRREIGKQVGLLYKKWGRTGVKPSVNLDPYYSKQLFLYQKHYPQYLEYLAGVASGLGLKKEAVFKLFITIFLPKVWQDNQCSAFAVNNDHGVFVGRNYDWFPVSEQNSAFFRFEYQDKANSFFGITDFGVMHQQAKKYQFVFAPEDGWNKAGLYLCLNGAPKAATGFGLSSLHLLQLVLETCSTVDQAVAVLEKVPIPRTKMFLVADKSGALAVVEKNADQETEVIQSKEYLYMVNHFQTKKLKANNLKLFKQFPFHSSFARAQFLNLNLSRGYQQLNFTDCEDLLAKKPLVQEWRSEEQGNTVTVWRSVVRLDQKEYKIVLAPLQPKEEKIIAD